MQRIRKKCAGNGRASAHIAVFTLLLACSGGCRAPELPATETAEITATHNRCGASGFLTTALYGAITTTIEWASADLECEGMPRPGGAGARLRFAGVQDEQPIAIIIALPQLRRGATAKELETRITLIPEGTGRFFSNASAEHCLTDITSIEAVDSTDNRVAISGTVYCVVPLVQVNDSPSVSVPKLEFRGLLDWNAS